MSKEEFLALAETFSKYDPMAKVLYRNLDRVCWILLCILCSINCLNNVQCPRQ